MVSAAPAFLLTVGLERACGIAARNKNTPAFLPSAGCISAARSRESMQNLPCQYAGPPAVLWIHVGMRGLWLVLEVRQRGWNPMRYQPLYMEQVTS